jgi:hypothetical protein
MRRFGGRPEAVAAGCPNRTSPTVLTDHSLPQWEAIQRFLTSRPPSRGSVTASVRGLLINCSGNWQQGLRIYSAGLRVHAPKVVIVALEHVSQAEKDQGQAESRLSELEHPERSLAR